MPECIFVSKPKECAVCLDSRKLQCLLNKRHLRLRDTAREELIALLLQDIASQDRYKTISGEEGRHH